MAILQDRLVECGKLIDLSDAWARISGLEEVQHTACYSASSVLNNALVNTGALYIPDRVLGKCIGLGPLLLWAFGRFVGWFAHCLCHYSLGRGAHSLLPIVSSLLIWCLKVICTMCNVGCKEYWVCSNEPGHALPVLGSLVCLSVSAVGSIFMIGDFAVAINNARFLTSFSALLIFTKSQQFNQILHTFVGVIDNASALFSALVAVSCLYALAGQDIFGNKVQVQPVIGWSLIVLCCRF